MRKWRNQSVCFSPSTVDILDAAAALRKLQPYLSRGYGLFKLQLEFAPWVCSSIANVVTRVEIRIKLLRKVMFRIFHFNTQGHVFKSSVQWVWSCLEFLFWTTFQDQQTIVGRKWLFTFCYSCLFYYTKWISLWYEYTIQPQAKCQTLLYICWKLGERNKLKQVNALNLISRKSTSYLQRTISSRRYNSFYFITNSSCFIWMRYSSCRFQKIFTLVMGWMFCEILV